MEEPFAIRQRDDHWVVLARDQEILTCAELTCALRAVKEATDILNYAALLERGDSNSVVSYSHSTLNALQLVAHKNGFKNELHDERFYLRSLEPVTLQNSPSPCPLPQQITFLISERLARFAAFSLENDSKTRPRELRLAASLSSLFVWHLPRFREASLSAIGTRNHMPQL
jgi:hypothetical protein